MPREVVTVSVGQTGLQIGWRFWDLLLREQAQHAAGAGGGLYDECLSTFFRNWDAGAGRELRLGPAGAGAVRLAGLRARAVLVDTEEGVAHQLLRSPLGALFDRAQLVTDVSGAGNNWAHGYFEYGPAMSGALAEAVRRALEACDSPQSFFLMQSLGGGTGSGLGTYLMEQLADDHPELYRFTTALFPSGHDDVVTSPYNFGLAVTRLAEAADCILPLENQALADVVGAIAAKRSAGAGGARAGGGLAVAPASSLDYCPPLPAGCGAIDRLQLGLDVWGVGASSGSGGSSSSSGGGGGGRRLVAPPLASTLTSGPGRPPGAAPRPGGGGAGSNGGGGGAAGPGSAPLHAQDSPPSELLLLEQSLAAADALLAAVHKSGSLGVADPRSAPRGVARASSSGSGSRAGWGASALAPSAAGRGRGGGGAGGTGSRAGLRLEDSRRRSSGSGSGSSSSSSAASSAPPRGGDGAHELAHATGGDEGDDDSPAAAPPRRRGAARTGTAWDGMNNLAAHLLTHLTASMRFEGPLNVDLNEVTSTLVPFQQLNMLQASLTPLFALADVAVQGSARATAAMFNDAFTRGHQLARGDPRSATHMAVGLLLRGDVALSDVRANVERLRREGVVRLASWNPDGFKVGLCAQPPLHQPYSLLALSNNTSMAGPLAAGRDRFAHLWRVRAHVHHYTRYMEPALFEDALEALDALVCGYRRVAA